MSSSKQSNKLLLMLPIASPVEYVIQKYRNFFFSLHTSWLSWNKPFAWPTCWASHIVAEAHSTSSRHSRRLGLRCWSAKINKIWILEKWDTNWQPQGRPVTFVRHQKSDFFFLAQVNILGMLIWPISYLNFRPGVEIFLDPTLIIYVSLSLQRTFSSPKLWYHHSHRDH